MLKINFQHQEYIKVLSFKKGKWWSLKFKIMDHQGIWIEDNPVFVSWKTERIHDKKIKNLSFSVALGSRPRNKNCYRFG